MGEVWQAANMVGPEVAGTALVCIFRFLLVAL
jgi:hypothetical protein